MRTPVWTSLEVRDGSITAAPLQLAECGYDLLLSSQGRCLLVSFDHTVARQPFHAVRGLNVIANNEPRADRMNRIAASAPDRIARTGPYYGYLLCRIHRAGPLGGPNRLHRIMVGLVGSRTRSMGPIGPLYPRCLPAQQIPIRYERFIARRLISWWSTAPLKQEAPRWKTRTH